MSGKGKNKALGETHRCSPMDAPQQTFSGKVTSNNREQHLGRSFPETNGTMKLRVADGGLRPVPAMPVTPKQAYSQEKVSKGQKMPNGDR